MANLSDNSVEFKERKRKPCPVCAHRDRCKFSIKHGDDLVLCFRESQESVSGYRLIRLTGDCATYVRTGSEADNNGKRHNSGPEPRVQKPGLDDLAARYATALTDVHAERFARDLGVSAASLRKLGAGMRGNRLCFPERNGAGNVIGISTRYPDQKRRYMVGEGHERGLLIPASLPSELTYLLFPEGPSDTTACLDLGLNAVGRPNNGSKAELVAEYARRAGLAVILGENDEKPDGSWPGRNGAISVATDVADRIGRTVLWALVPPGFKDVRDFLKANAARDPNEVRRELLAHIFSTAVPIQPSVSFGGASLEESAENWADPQPLPNELPPVAAFDLDLLPEAFRNWIQDIVERAQCPADYPAVGAIVALAALVGRKIAIRPKQRDDWTVVANLWGGIIGRPGLLKTPMLMESTRPLCRLEIAAKKQFQDELQQLEVKLLVRKAEREELEKAIKKALKEGEDAEAVAKAGLDKRESRPVIRKRYMINDTTVEKLGELLNENPNGVLMYRDELIGMLRALDKDGQECARAFYLEAWNGTGRFAYDRIGRGTIEIEAAIVSILGGIQPSVLRAYLQSSLDRIGNDGLIQRFQLLVWPDVSKGWRNVDEWPDTEAKNRAYEVFSRLDALEPDSVGAKAGESKEEIPFLRFDLEAQAMFDDWRGGLERQLRSGELHPLLEEHFSKYRSLIPSLALLFHLADGGTGAVRVGALQRAIRWGEYLASHARRVYHVASNPDIAAATAISRKILSGDIGDGFVLRDIYRHEWAGLGDRDIVQGGVNLLCDLDWLQRFRIETVGAPKTQYSVNPKILALARKGTDKTDKSSGNGLLSVLSGPSDTGADENRELDSDGLDEEVHLGSDSITRTPPPAQDDGQPTTDSNSACDPPGMAEGLAEFIARFDPSPESLELWKAHYRREHGAG